MSERPGMPRLTPRSTQDDFAIHQPDGVQRHRRMTGYVPSSEVAYRVYNLVLAGALLLLTLPLMLGLAIAVRVVLGPSVLDRAPRVGRNGAVFHMLSFQTARRGCDTMFGDGAARARALGIFLHTTGLDELPQLWNVVRGDMNLVGPRPVRPAIAAIETARDPLFSVRFTVKPGLFGHAQAFMSRGASQRLRGKMTYQRCRTAVNLPIELMLIGRVVWAMVRRSVACLTLRPEGPGHLARARHKAENWQMRVETKDGTYPVYAFSQGLLTTPHLVTGGPARLVFTTGKGGVRRASVTLSRINHLGGETVFHYTPAHEHAIYTINRYLRQDVLVLPCAPRWHRPVETDLTQEMPLQTPPRPETVETR